MLIHNVEGTLIRRWNVGWVHSPKLVNVFELVRSKRSKWYWYLNKCIVFFKSSAPITVSSFLLSAYITTTFMLTIQEKAYKNRSVVVELYIFSAIYWYTSFIISSSLNRESSINWHIFTKLCIQEIYDLPSNSIFKWFAKQLKMQWPYPGINVNIKSSSISIFDCFDSLSVMHSLLDTTLIIKQSL